MRVLLGIAILLPLAGIVRAQPAEGVPEELKKAWDGLDRAAKIDALMRLEARPSAAVLEQCGRWLRQDRDVVVRGHLVRVIASCASTDGRLHPRARKLIGTYVVSHLKARAREEKREFEEVCRKFGKTVPPDTKMAAGRDWKDPYDENRRALPERVKDERICMREVVAAIEAARVPGLNPALGRIMREHHDPEVLTRVVEAYGALKEWRGLPGMADLLRIQLHGRTTGGGDVIGRKEFAVLRLKWDLHKDRLWWSRPEYVPRVKRPIYAAVKAITGAEVASARELDGWLLSHEALLKEHGVKLSGAFKTRAKSTQR